MSVKSAETPEEFKVRKQQKVSAGFTESKGGGGGGGGGVEDMKIKKHDKIQQFKTIVHGEKVESHT